MVAISLPGPPVSVGRGSRGVSVTLGHWTVGCRRSPAPSPGGIVRQFPLPGVSRAGIARGGTISGAWADSIGVPMSSPGWTCGELIGASGRGGLGPRSVRLLRLCPRWVRGVSSLFPAASGWAESHPQIELRARPGEAECSTGPGTSPPPRRRTPFFWGPHGNPRRSGSDPRVGCTSAPSMVSPTAMYGRRHGSRSLPRSPSPGRRAPRPPTPGPAPLPRAPPQPVPEGSGEGPTGEAPASRCGFPGATSPPQPRTVPHHVRPGVG